MISGFQPLEFEYWISAFSFPNFSFSDACFPHFCFSRQRPREPRSALDLTTESTEREKQTTESRKLQWEGDSLVGKAEISWLPQAPNRLQYRHEVLQF